jgi:predicted DNA-binding antitoxin AbrB/MazE fold protein
MTTRFSRVQEACYTACTMGPVEASYENGLLRPVKPLSLRAGERVALIIVRHPDAARWDLARLVAASAQDEGLAEAGLADWAAELDVEDHR